ncbi:SAM-dependent methyltransferase [Mycolicibacillus koreensis]|nr:SAM-dependent methyltransferase [Mycolicibacillus koreensis]
MPESSIVVRPDQPGSASYLPSARLDTAGLARAVALFKQAAQAVPLYTPPQPIVIADYGAATGYNSMLPIGAAIDAIRERTRLEHAIMVAHTDLPDNDFNALFHTIADDADSYLQKDPATFSAAIGRSFYDQILPSNAVTLGWTSWAVMWLRTVPSELRDHVFVAYSTDDAARSAYARQATADWQNFLAFRGRELRPGGRLLVLTAAVGDDGEYGYQPLVEAILAGLHDLVGATLISTEEVRRMTIPIVVRSEKDLRAPFAPHDRFEGLAIEHLEIFDAGDRFWSQYQRDQDTAAFGAQWAAFARASLFPALCVGLDGGRRDPRVSEFADRLEQAVAAKMAVTPEPVRIPLAAVVMVKRQPTD